MAGKATQGRLILPETTAAQLKTSNPILKARQLHFEADTGKAKLGDGVKPWNDLPYAGGASDPDLWKGLSGTYVGENLKADSQWVDPIGAGKIGINFNLAPDDLNYDFDFYMDGVFYVNANIIITQDGLLGNPGTSSTSPSAVMWVRPIEPPYICIGAAPLIGFQDWIGCNLSGIAKVSNGGGIGIHVWSPSELIDSDLCALTFEIVKIG